MRPLVSQNFLYKLQNVGWSVSRPTVVLVTLACVSLHFFLFFFACSEELNESTKNRRRMKKSKNIKEKKKASKVYLFRDGTTFFMNVTRKLKYFFFFLRLALSFL